MAQTTHVTYEPELAPASERPVHGFVTSANDDFDEALEQLTGSGVSRHRRTFGPRDALLAAETAGSPPSAAAALIGAGAVVAGTHRIVLRPPDEPKRRSWWFARFPRI